MFHCHFPSLRRSRPSPTAPKAHSISATGHPRFSLSAACLCSTLSRIFPAISQGGDFVWANALMSPVAPFAQNNTRESAAANVSYAPTPHFYAGQTRSLRLFRASSPRISPPHLHIIFDNFALQPPASTSSSQLLEMLCFPLCRLMYRAFSPRSCPFALPFSLSLSQLCYGQ